MAALSPEAGHGDTLLAHRRLSLRRSQFRGARVIVDESGGSLPFSPANQRV
jgi:hypothetical protein